MMCINSIGSYSFICDEVGNEGYPELTKNNGNVVYLIGIKHSLFQMQEFAVVSLFTKRHVTPELNCKVMQCTAMHFFDV